MSNRLDMQKWEALEEAGETVNYQITCAQDVVDALQFAALRAPTQKALLPTVEQILLAMEREGLEFGPTGVGEEYDDENEEVYDLMDHEWPEKNLWDNLVDIMVPIRSVDSPWNSPFPYLEFLNTVQDACDDFDFEIDFVAKAPGEPHLVSQALTQLWHERPRVEAP